MMKAAIEAISPRGYKVLFEIESAQGFETAVSRLADIETALRDAGYRPSVEMRSPEGLPICEKHQVYMDRREKQGDVWFSHPVVTVDGSLIYCKGRAGKDSPGWDID